ncbi:MAG TPA: hypothetical protein VEY05_01160 [Beijerinckiaceae bacterium]|jgi:hypothetical protein|nr:hypothetical protein [Beijerinckiaceae bacterium]
MSHLSTTRPAAPRFWVIGGEYTCLEFEQLVEGSEKVAGPFFHKSAAEAVWRRLSEADRSRAQVRYAIVTERGHAA